MRLFEERFHLERTLIRCKLYDHEYNYLIMDKLRNYTRIMCIQLLFLGIYEYKLMLRVYLRCSCNSYINIVGISVCVSQLSYDLFPIIIQKRQAGEFVFVSNVYSCT